MKILKKEKIKEVVVELVKDETSDEDIYIVKIESRKSITIIKKCKFRPNADQVFKEQVKKYSTMRKYY